MLTRNYAFVVEGDVFYTMSFPESLPIAGRWVAGLSSNPKFIECSMYPEICVGAIWQDNNFYLPEDTEKNNPIAIFESGTTEHQIKFAALVDQDVFGLLTFPTNEFPIEVTDLLRAGFKSNPTAVEISPDTLVEVGWTWDGLNFYPPQER